MEKTHSKVDAEHMGVTVGHLKNTLHTLTKQLWCINILQNGLQMGHYQLKHAKALNHTSEYVNRVYALGKDMIMD